MTTKKNFLIAILFLLLSIAAKAQPNNKLILQFDDGFNVTQQHLNSIFAPNNPTIIDQSNCFNAYLLQFNNTALPFLSNCDSLRVLVKGDAVPHTTTKIKSGGWNSTENIPPFVVNNPIVSVPDSLWVLQWKHLRDTLETRPMCNVKIAFLDTGIDPSHLSSNPWFARTTAFGVNTPNINGVTIDGHGHGTHVIGISAQLLKEYSNISLLSIKTQKDDGSSSIWDVIKGIEIAVQQGAKIVNMSLGYSPSCPVTDLLEYEDALKSVMRFAGEKYNTLFVTAAGNDGMLLQSASGSFVTYPSMFRLPTQINVANNNNLGVLHSSSNHGADFVTVSTTGVNIWSSDKGNTYSKQTGTSMAAPHVTATTAVNAALNCGGNFSVPTCGVRAVKNPNALFMLNNVVQSGTGPTPALKAGVLQPYFAIDSKTDPKKCKCH